MSKALTGEQAVALKLNGFNVEYALHGLSWSELTDEEFRNWQMERFLNGTSYIFRVAPQRITINNTRVPAPSIPKHGDIYFYLNTRSYCGYSSTSYSEDLEDYVIQFGAWETEDEIKQVVEALKLNIWGK